MRNGSVGLVNLSLPSGSRGMMGRINMRITSTCSTTTQPTRLASKTATRLLRMRQRSSSTWSRKGISPRFSRVSDTPAPPRPQPQTRERLPPQALELVAREVGLWRAGVAGDDPGVVRPRRRLVAPLLGEETQLVERRRCPRRSRIGLHDLLIHRGRRVRVLPGKRLTDEVEGVGRSLVGRKHPQELSKGLARRSISARPVLLIREVVHLLRPRARRADRHGRAAAARVQCRDGLAGLLFQPPAQLGQTLLALARQLLHAHELLLHGQQIGLHVAAQLHQVRLLRRQLLLRRAKQRAHRVDFTGALAVGTGALDAQRFDLELDAPDVAFQRASGGEPQGEHERPSMFHPSIHGCFRFSPPERISNSSRRFCAHDSSSCPEASGRSSPYDTVSIRLPSMPWMTTYCLAAVARRLPSARLYSSDPRSSQWPLMRMRSAGLA